MHRLHAVPLIALSAALSASLLAGCSFSKSSGASSRSSSSPSRWVSESSRSSSGGGSQVDDATYEEDVAQTTAAFVSSGGELDAWRRVMSQLAEKQGISNWEDDEPTMRAVGEGIARATEDPAKQSKAITMISGGNEKRKAWLQQGAGTSF